MVNKYRVKIFFNNGIAPEFICNKWRIKPNDGLYLYEDENLIYGIPMQNILYYELHQE